MGPIPVAITAPAAHDLFWGEYDGGGDGPQALSGDQGQSRRECRDGRKEGRGKE